MTRKVLSVLGSNANRQVFEAVAKARTVRVKDLENSLGMSRENILEALEELEGAGLVEVLEAPEHLEGFRTSYPTAEGLSTQRELRRLELA